LPALRQVLVLDWCPQTLQQVLQLRRLLMQKQQHRLLLSAQIPAALASHPQV
jgi:hypothetical protein